MNYNITINPETLGLINFMNENFFLESNLISYRWPYQKFNDSDISLEEIQKILKTIDHHLRDSEYREDSELPFSTECISDCYWLTYDENIETIPIYDDYLSLVKKNLILQPNEIPSLLHYIGVPKSNDGVVIENHNFGYHFHFGHIKKHKLERTDLLLTFDPTDQYPFLDEHENKKNITLYAEKHGGYKKIDIATIGNNKRKPIYNVCEAEISNRGLDNFRKPTKSAQVFYK
jgi:hypothetical protein